MVKPGINGSAAQGHAACQGHPVGRGKEIGPAPGNSAEAQRAIQKASKNYGNSPLSTDWFKILSENLQESAIFNGKI
jgi:hypothetical protein